MVEKGLSTWRVYCLIDKILLTHALGALGGAPIAMIFNPKDITHVILAGWIIGVFCVIAVAVIRLFDLDKEPEKPLKNSRYRVRKRLDSS